MVKIDVRPENPYPMKCSWCKKITGFSTIKGSDSICDECKDKLLTADLVSRKKQ